MGRRLGFIFKSYCLAFLQLANGYSYQVNSLAKISCDNRIEQYWIGIADYHDKLSNANRLQRAKIENVLKKCDKSNILVIAEDLCSNQQLYLQEGFYINSQNGILAGIIRFCQTNQIPNINIEYRYNRVIALSPFIYNPNINPLDCSCAKRISVRAILDEINHAQTAFLHANDQSFKNITNHFIPELQDQINSMQLKNFQNKSMAEYIQEFSIPFNRISLIKKLLTFDGILISLNIVYQTLKASDKKKIIVLAGGTHIAQADEILQKIGYCALAPESKKNKLVALKNMYREKPEPISLEILEHYLKN